jgi:hypothetical protein
VGVVLDATVVVLKVTVAGLYLMSMASFLVVL